LESKNKEVVLALREIAAGKVYPVTAEEAAQARAEAEARERQRLSAAAKALPAEGDEAGEAAPADDPPAKD
jgi:DNA-directed RNA polymerase subunit omega